MLAKFFKGLIPLKVLIMCGVAILVFAWLALKIPQSALRVFKVLQ
jgi:hypothetical protein